MEVIIGQQDQRAVVGASKVRQRGQTEAEKKQPGQEVGFDYPQIGITVVSFKPGTGPPMATAENIQILAKTTAFLNRLLPVPIISLAYRVCIISLCL